MNRPTLANALALSLTILLPASLAACMGGQTGDIASPNCDGPDDPHPFADVTPLGFSGQDALGSMPATYTGALAWSDNTQSDLTVTLAHDAVIQNEGLVQYHDPFDADHPMCAPRLDVPVAIALATDDGLLDEPFVAYLAVPALGEGTVQAALYADALQGTADLESFATPGTWDPASAQLFIEISLDAAGTTGVLALQTHSEGTGDSTITELAVW